MLCYDVMQLRQLLLDQGIKSTTAELGLGMVSPNGTIHNNGLAYVVLETRDEATKALFTRDWKAAGYPGVTGERFIPSSGLVRPVCHVFLFCFCSFC